MQSDFLFSLTHLYYFAALSHRQLSKLKSHAQELSNILNFKILKLRYLSKFIKNSQFGQGLDTSVTLNWT